MPFVIYADGKRVAEKTRCDTSQTVTLVVAAVPCSRVFSVARLKSMGTEFILSILIVIPAVVSVAIFRWASEEWLRGFAILARSWGRLM